MTREEKTRLLKKELYFITNISSKYDMSQPSEAARIKRALAKDGGMFKTSMGAVYTQRLDEIIGDMPVSLCCLCNTEEAVDKVICRSCMKKFSQGKHFYGENVAEEAVEEVVEEQAVEEETVAEETVAEETVAEETAAEEAVEEVAPEESTEDVVEETAAVEEAVEDPFKDLIEEPDFELFRDEITYEEPETKKNYDFFESNEYEYEEEYTTPNLYRRVLIPGLAIAAIFIIVLIGIVVSRYGKGKPVADENGVEFIISTGQKTVLGDATDARNYVDEYFSWKDGYEVEFDEDYQIPLGWSWTPSGMPVQYTENAFLTIEGGKYLEDMQKTFEGWRYSIKKEAPGGNKQGYLYIDKFANAYLSGNFENCPVEKYIYRVK